MANNDKVHSVLLHIPVEDHALVKQEAEEQERTVTAQLRFMLKPAMAALRSKHDQRK